MLLACHHPKPSYPLHILILPKQPYQTLLDVPAGDPFLGELWLTVQQLVQQYGLAQHGYRLITNGGAFQEVAHLHFHLVSDAESYNE